MKKFKKLINKLFVLLYVFIIYRPYKNKFVTSEIAVVGRGHSANYYFNKFKNSPKIVGLVNFTDQDLKKIDIKILNKKEIIIFFNITGETISIKHLLKLNIKGMVRTSNESYDQGIARYNNLNILHKYFLNVLPKFPTHLSKYVYLGNSGLLSIVYMVDYFQPKRVLLFGFNFYQNKMIREYLPHEKELNEELTALKIAGLKLKTNFLQLCNSFPKINFYHYDENEIEKLANLYFINIKKLNE